MHADGSHHAYDNNGHRTAITTRNGAEARFDTHGRMTTIHDRGTTIHRGIYGERHIETRRADGARVVSLGAHRGFVEHSFARGGHEYSRRTYVAGGRSYVHVYRSYSYRGVVYHRYVPAYYYHAGFYGWAYRPWAAPVYYRWGWASDPWYAYYGGYWAPYPAYSAPSLWLTDFLLAANLQAAYENAQAAAQSSAAQSEQSPAVMPQSAQSAGMVPISPEIKEAIAEEVRQQLMAEQQSAAPQPSATSPQPNAASLQQPASTAEEVPPALDPNHRVFVVSAALDLQVDGQECGLTPGDIISRIDDTPSEDNSVRVSVLSGKKTDCRPGSMPNVQVADLQEMQNDFRTRVDEGLATMAKGGNGLPRVPDSATTPSEVPQQVADLTAGRDLEKQAQDANQTEADLRAAANGSQR